MKNVLISAAVAAFLATGSLPAQPPSTLRVKVPFSFKAGTVDLPAGQYQVSTTAPALCTLRAIDSGRSVRILGKPASSTPRGDRPALSFNCYGENCFLSSVSQGGGDGMAISPGLEEMKIAATVTRTTKKILVASGAHE